MWCLQSTFMYIETCLLNHIVNSTIIRQLRHYDVWNQHLWRIFLRQLLSWLTTNVVIFHDKYCRVWRQVLSYSTTIIILYQSCIILKAFQILTWTEFKNPELNLVIKSRETSFLIFTTNIFQPYRYTVYYTAYYNHWTVFVPKFCQWVKNLHMFLF